MRNVAILIAVAVACAICHRIFLRGIARTLVVDQQGRPATALLLIGGDRRFEIVAHRVADGTKSVLIRRLPPGRLVRMGILPTAEELARRELKKHRISDQQVELLGESTIDNSRVPECLGNWLQQHPGADIDILCARFDSSRWDRRLCHALDANLRTRIHIIALADREFDEWNWWRSKRGVLAVLNAYLRLAFDYCHGDSRDASRERSDDELEIAFLKAAS